MGTPRGARPCFTARMARLITRRTYTLAHTNTETGEGWARAAPRGARHGWRGLVQPKQRLRLRRRGNGERLAHCTCCYGPAFPSTSTCLRPRTASISRAPGLAPCLPRGGLSENTGVGGHPSVCSSSLALPCPALPASPFHRSPVPPLSSTSSNFGRRRVWRAAQRERVACRVKHAS